MKKIQSIGNLELVDEDFGDVAVNLVTKSEFTCLAHIDEFMCAWMEDRFNSPEVNFQDFCYLCRAGVEYLEGQKQRHNQTKNGDKK